MRVEHLRKTTLADVAKKCGVSSSTVSRVLSGFSDGFSVTDNLREKIENAAEEMNYIPNATARQLRTKKTMTIHIFGFFFRWYGSYSLILEYCAEVLNKKGYMVNAVFGDYDQVQFGPMSSDGIVLITANDKNLLNRIRKSNLPYVVINEKLDDNECWVEFDDLSGITENMNYLINNGHKKIVYCEYSRKIDHPLHSSLEIRKKGYIDTCHKNGLTPIITPPGLSPEEIYEFILDHEASSIISYHADNAAEIVEALSSQGVQVPQQIEIVTFGYPTRNIDRISYSEVNLKETGQVVANILLKRIEKGIISNCTFKQYHHQANKVLHPVLGKNKNSFLDLL